MKMNKCEYHEKMYWLTNEEREFKNLIKYTNSFIVTYSDLLYPEYLIYRKFKNGNSCVKWASKLNAEFKDKYNTNKSRIGVNRFYLDNASEKYIKNYEAKHSPNLKVVKHIPEEEKETEKNEEELERVKQDYLKRYEERNRTKGIRFLELNDLYGVEYNDLKYTIAMKINEMIETINELEGDRK